jgi:hypothetical protein
LYVKTNLACGLRTDFDSSDIEAIWLEMFKLVKQRLFIFGYTYRSPSSPTSWNDQIEYILDKLYVRNKEIILFGDLNYKFYQL